MATVTTTIDQDQDDLYEYTLEVNGEQVHADGGFTREQHALDDAKAEFKKWFDDRS